MAPTMSMRRIASIPSGPYGTGYGRLVCCDSDHDSLPELTFATGTIYPYDPLRLEVWEHQGWNRFSLVYADTGAYPEPPGITVGNAIPFAAGDIDGDGLTDIVCINTDERDSGLFYDIVMTLESPDLHSYPCSLSWYYRYANNEAIPVPTYYPPDLDGDGHREVLLSGTWIWENRGNDSNELVWCNHECGFGAFGDFGGDGRMELAGGGPPQVWECTGDDQYVRVYEDTTYLPPMIDVFMTNDIDCDGRPEFYVTRYSYPDSRMWLHMYEVESGGGLTRTLVDSLRYWGNNEGLSSVGGDIDGDGIDECIWTTYDSVRAYKAFGNNDLRQVWHWENDSVTGPISLTTTIYDVNNDGYNELLLARDAKISIFEVDAVDLLSPNGGACSVGDTVLICWVTNHPPRCDSLSLYLRRDSLWHLQTIATGLPAADTLYRWVVPANVPDTGRIVAIAYGPGWQYDMSDSVIHFSGGAVAEAPRRVPLQWSLSVGPNPARGAFVVRYDVPHQTHVSVGLYDATGRLVRSLSDGEVSPGRYEARLPAGTIAVGIYFLRLDTPGFRSVKKAVVTR
jgi:hypothetical protein